MDLIGTLVGGSSVALVIVLAVLLVLKQKVVNAHLPKAVRQFVNDATVREIVLYLGDRLDLDNAAKRAEAVKQVDEFVKARTGIDLPERYLNLLVELAYHRLVEEGLLR